MKTWQIFMASMLILAVGEASTANAERVVSQDQEVIETTQMSQNEPVVVETRTTIVEKHEGADVDIDVGSGGIVSSTFDLAGDVLAFPFKIIGAGIGLLF